MKWHAPAATKSRKVFKSEDQSQGPWPWCPWKGIISRVRVRNIKSQSLTVKKYRGQTDKQTDRTKNAPIIRSGTLKYDIGTVRGVQNTTWWILRSSDSVVIKLWTWKQELGSSHYGFRNFVQMYLLSREMTWIALKRRKITNKPN